MTSRRLFFFEPVAQPIMGSGRSHLLGTRAEDR